MIEVDNPSQAKLYKPVTTVILTVGLYIFAQIAAGIILSIVPLLSGWGKAKTEAWLGSTTAVGLYLIIAAVVTVWCTRILLKRRKANLKTIGLNTFQMAYIGYAVGAFVIYLGLFIGVRALAIAIFPSININQEQDLGFTPGIHGVSLLIVFLCLVVLPPLAEEIAVRGFLYTSLRRNLTIPLATIITSVMFGLAHLWGGKDGVIWIATLDTFTLSVVLCYVREKTGSLWPGMGVHMIKNVLAFMLLFIVMK